MAKQKLDYLQDGILVPRSLKGMATVNENLRETAMSIDSDPREGSTNDPDPVSEYFSGKDKVRVERVTVHPDSTMTQ